MYGRNAISFDLQLPFSRIGGKCQQPDRDFRQLIRREKNGTGTGQPQPPAYARIKGFCLICGVVLLQQRTANRLQREGATAGLRECDLCHICSFRKCLKGAEASNGKDKIFFPQGVTADLRLRGIVQKISHHINLAILELDPAGVADICLGGAVKVNGKDPCPGTVPVGIFGQSGVPVGQGGKEILHKEAESAAAAVHETVGNEDRSIPQKSCRRTVAAGQGEVQQTAPCLAVIVRYDFFAIVAPNGIFPQKRHDLAIAAGEHGDFTQLEDRVCCNHDRLAPGLAAIVGVVHFLHERLVKIVRRDDKAPRIQFDQLIRHHAPQRRFHRFAPGFAIVAGVIDQHFLNIFRQMSIIHGNSKRSIRKTGDPGTVVTGLSGGFFGQRVLFRPGAPPVVRLGEHNAAVRNRIQFF